MNIKTAALSVVASGLLMAASPMVSTSMSTDNGGTKSAIDAYSDGAGILMINHASDTKFDNSAMNKLVFKYGDAAKSSNTTLKNQVNVLSPSATTQEKADATSKLEVAKIVINPPSNGTSCDDGNPNTSGDVWSGGSCVGIPTVFTSCNAIKTAIPSSADGTYNIDPDGASGAASFPVYCDMTTDGGGWTKVGAGTFWSGYSDAVSANTTLTRAKLQALFDVSQKITRFGTGATTLFIKDQNIIDYSGANPHVYQSISTSLLASKTYASVLANTMTTITSKSITCSTLGFGLHNCGVVSGWILLHANGIYNTGGNHPLGYAASGDAVSGALNTMWLK